MSGRRSGGRRLKVNGIDHGGVGLRRELGLAGGALHHGTGKVVGEP